MDIAVGKNAQGTTAPPWGYFWSFHGRWDSSNCGYWLKYAEPKLEWKRCTCICLLVGFSGKGLGSVIPVGLWAPNAVRKPCRAATSLSVVDRNTKVRRLLVLKKYNMGPMEKKNVLRRLMRCWIGSWTTLSIPYFLILKAEKSIGWLPRQNEVDVWTRKAGETEDRTWGVKASPIVFVQAAYYEVDGGPEGIGTGGMAPGETSGNLRKRKRRRSTRTRNGSSGIGSTRRTTQGQSRWRRAQGSRQNQPNHLQDPGFARDTTWFDARKIQNSGMAHMPEEEKGGGVYHHGDHHGRRNQLVNKTTTGDKFRRPRTSCASMGRPGGERVPEDHNQGTPPLAWKFFSPWPSNAVQEPGPTEAL